MIARDLCPRLLRQADRSQVTANLAGRVIEDSERDGFQVIEFFANFGMDSLTELIYIHSRFPKRQTNKGTLPILILESIMDT